MAVAKPDSPVSQTRPSGFSRFKTKEYFEDYRAQDGTSTSLVSFRTHNHPEEKDLVDEGTKAKGRNSKEGKRWALQHYSVDDPDEARMEGEGEDQHACTHSLR
jgi:hypothetical protein